MTTEELRVKIVVDTSDLKNSVNKAKKEINGVTDGINGTNKATSATAASMEELADTMAEIKSMGAFTLLARGIKGLKNDTKDLSSHMDKLKSHIKNAGKEFKAAFDFKNFDVGNDGVKGYLGSTLTGLKETTVSLKGALKNLGAGFKDMAMMASNALNNIYVKAGAVLAVLVSVVALIRNGLGVSELAKQTNVLAQQAGMSVNAYQKWAFILGQAGLAVDDMIGAQQTLLEAQVDVREGSEDIIKAFQQIGLSQEQVLGMNQQQLFERTVEGLQNVSNQTERATLAYKLLSEDSKNLAPLLNMTSQQVAILANNFNTLNGAMSEGLIRTSNRLQASLGNLRAAWQGLKNTLAELVLPVIISVVNWLTKAIAIVNLFVRTVFGLDIGGAVNAGVDTATSGIGGYTEAVESATGAVEKLKRTVMGFDELNVVTNPNAGGAGSGAGAGAGAGGGGFAGGVTDGLFNADALDMSKYQEWFAKYKTLIQDITTWGLIGVGVGVAVLGALTGNIPVVLAGLGLAGIGFAVGNVDDGTFDRLRQKFQDMNLGLVPMAMVGIGAVGAVVSLLMGNIPAAIGFAALAGIGLSMGGGEDIKNLINKYEQEIKGVIAPSMIGVGAIVAPLALMLGNIPLAIAGLALIGGGLAIGGLMSGGIGKFITEYGSQINKAVAIAVTAVGALACIICLLTGNIPGAIAFGVLAGLGLAQLGTGGTFFSDAVKAIKNMWEGLKTWFNTTIKPIFTKAYWSEKWQSINTAASEKLSEIKGTVVEKWNGVKSWWNSTVAPIFTKQYWLNKFDVIKTSISTKIAEAKTALSTGWSNVKNYFTSTIAPKFTKAYWQAKFEPFRSAFNEKLTAAKTVLTNIWGNIKAYFTTNIAPKFTLTYWRTKFDNIRASASEKFNAAKLVFTNGWASVKTWFNTNVAPKFTVTYWSNKFSSIKNGAKAAFNGVIAVVEKAVNGIITKINTLSWKIPNWVPKYGGQRFGFNFRTVTIPRLAEGGIAMRSTLANIGENGREAVLPLDNNTGWMDKLADRIAARNGPTKVVLQVGEKELGWATIGAINGITKQTGGLQLTL